MNADEIIKCVGRCRSIRQLGSLVDQLRAAEQDVLFQTLFQLAVRKQGHDQGPVAMSAYALHALNPPCLLSVDEAVSSLLNDWDPSIEELPWYLVKQFGAEAVLRSAEKLAAGIIDGSTKARLLTIKYWVAAAR
jgi:hypothetical protein